MDENQVLNAETIPQNRSKRAEIKLKRSASLGPSANRHSGGSIDNCASKFKLHPFWQLFLDFFTIYTYHMGN